MLIVCLSLPTVLPPSSPVNKPIEVEAAHTIAEADVDPMFPDVDLYQAPQYGIAGESGEFSYFHSAFYDDDQGVSMMMWNHTANTTLTSDDGVYFEKMFDWPHDEYPRSMHLSFEFAFEFIGDFIYSSTMRRYGTLRFYLITPAGEAHIIGYYWPPSGYYYQTYTIDCQPNIGTIWYEVLNDDSPDRNTTFTLRAGLFPGTDFFQGTAGSEAWRIYSGSMTLFMKSLDLLLTKGTPEDSEEVASPIWEGHWVTSPQNKEDYPPILTHGISDWSKGLAVLDDGSLVSLIHSHYDDEEYGFEDMVLLHWDTFANLLWYRRVDNCEPEAITSDGEYIYVTGSKDNAAFLSKWSANGDVVWGEIWDTDLANRGTCLAVDTEGSIYIHLRKRNATSGYYIDNHLVKVDANGDTVWYKFLNQTSYAGIYTGNSTSFFTFESVSRTLKEWDDQGNHLSTIEKVDFARVDLESLIVLRRLGFSDVNYPNQHWTKINLNRIEFDGTTVWSKNISIEYFPDYKENIVIREVEIAPDGSILILLFLDRYAEEYRLYHFLANGTFDWYRVVGWQPLRGVWDSYQMEAGSNGLVYLYALEFETYGNYLGDLVTRIEAYNYTNYTPPLILPQHQPYILIGAGVIGLLTFVLVIRRKRN